MNSSYSLIGFLVNPISAFFPVYTIHIVNIYIYINIYKYISRYSNSSIKIIRAFPTKYAICPLPTNCIDNIQQNLNIELKNNILKRFITPISRPTKVNCNIHFYNFLNQLTQLLNHFKYSLTSCNLSLTS